MTDYLKILRLDYLDYSQRRIADSARCSRHTIRKVLEVASKANIHWPLDGSRQDLCAKLFAGSG